MFERIVLAVDGSEHSRKAAALVERLAGERLTRQVLVVHVIEVAPRGMKYPVEMPEDAREMVDQVLRRLKDAGIGADAEIREAIHGNAAREIVDAADRFEADLIVMGSRGLSDWAGLVMGSVAHKVLHLSHRPVLIAR